MKKRVLCLVIAMVLAASMTACGLLFGSDSPSYMSQKDFESYLGEPIEITTDNWDEYFNVLVDQWARSDVQQMETESGLPEAAICIYEKPGYIVYEADGPVEFTINGVDFEYYNGRTEGVYISDYYNLVCESVSGSIRVVNIPDELWTVNSNIREITIKKSDGIKTYYEGYANAPYVTENDIFPYEKLEKPSESVVEGTGSGELTVEVFETFITEKVELTPDVLDDYFEIVEEYYETYSADGSEVTGGWSTYSIRLKEGYYVYPDSVSVTHHRQIWDGTQYNEYTITNSKRFASLGGDRVSISEFKEAQGTIIKVEIPEEYIEDGNCVYIKNGEEVIEFNLQ